MLVGPMKRRVVLTSIFSALIPIIILGVIGFLMYKNFNTQISELKAKAEVDQRYVLAKDLVANHVITAEDLRLGEVKAETIPADSYNVDTLSSLVGRRLKLNAKANTIVTSAMFFEEDKAPTYDLRLQEFNMITLPSDLVDNDYIDVRVRFPSGEDYSVLVGKRVESYSNNTIFIKLNEDEILTMGSAIIEAYMLDGTKLYANKYVDPANQLFEYKKVDYVAKYDNVVEALLATKREEAATKAVSDYLEQNPEATEEALNAVAANVTVSINDLSVADIANGIGLSVEETSSIQNAKLTNNSATLEPYRNRIEVVEKKISRTYPVKENVLNLIKSNPNILEEVKANFDTEAILAQRMTMQNTSLTGIDEMDEEKIQKVKEGLTTEIQTQKDERITYLRSLLNSVN